MRGAPGPAQAPRRSPHPRATASPDRASLAAAPPRAARPACGRPMNCAARDVAVGIALAQAHEHLSILKHLESPAAHRHLHGIKIPQGSDWPVRFEMSVLPRLAPICRSTTWLLYAENSLAPICRKFLGSYMPEDDRAPISSAERSKMARFVASHCLGLRAPKPGRWPRQPMLTRSEHCRWRASEAACRRQRAAAGGF